MKSKLFWLLIVILAPFQLIAQEKHFYKEGVFLEIGAGPGSNLGYKLGRLNGFSLPLLLNYRGETGWYGGLVFQAGELQTVVSYYDQRSVERFGQWMGGLQIGKLFPINRMLSADINVGASLLYTNGAAFWNDMDYLFGSDEYYNDVFQEAYANGSTSLSLVVVPHPQAPVYFKAGGYMNFNSFATSKGLLFSIGIRL